MPASEPLVSVVVATNRASDYLAEALASVREQTYTNLELIVVDDGSPVPDAISAAVAAVPKAVLLRTAPRGVSAARNAGADAARGQFLAFLDDDDRWHAERVARHVQAHREDASAIASYCGIRTVDASGTRVLAPADQVAVTSRRDVASRRTGILIGNFFVKRAEFEKIGGFDTGIHLAEDLDLILRLSARGRFAFVPGALVDYRAYGANSTGRHRELTASIDDVLRRHRDAARERGEAELVEAFTESIAKNHRFAWWSALRASRAALGRREPVTAASEIWWAARTAPSGLPRAVWRRVRGTRG